MTHSNYEDTPVKEAIPVPLPSVYIADLLMKPMDPAGAIVLTVLKGAAGNNERPLMTICRLVTEKVGVKTLCDTAKLKCT